MVTKGQAHAPKISLCQNLAYLCVQIHNLHLKCLHFRRRTRIFRTWITGPLSPKTPPRHHQRYSRKLLTTTWVSTAKSFSILPIYYVIEGDAKLPFFAITIFHQFETARASIGHVWTPRRSWRRARNRSIGAPPDVDGRDAMSDGVSLSKV